MKTSLLKLEKIYSLYRSPLTSRLIGTTFVNRGTIFPFKLADIGEGIKEVTIKEWHVVVGQKVSEFQNLCDVSSDKANVTISSRYSGTIKKIYYELDDLALVGQPLIDIELDEDSEKTIDVSSSEPVEAESPPATPKVESPQISSVMATPAVRRFAKEKNVNLSAVTGTGKNGRITNEDVLNYLNNQNLTEQSSTHGETSEDTLLPLTGSRKAMYNLMTESTHIPHFYAYENFNSGSMMAAHSLLKSYSGENYSIRLTVTSILVKAASLALSEYPIVNSKLDSEHKNIVFQNHHNIAVAMNTPTGLIVPVIHDVQSKNLLQISQILQEFAEKGQNNKFTVNDLSGGTFTISNTAPIGGLMGNSIIVPPQAAILSFGRPEKKLEKNSSGEINEVTYSTMVFSGDHRLIDGFSACGFLNRCKTLLENPVLMLASKN